MSHVVKMKAKIKRLADLLAAAKVFGLEYVEAQEFTYWAGQKEPCVGKLRLPDHTRCGEIGIRREPDGTYSLNYDQSYGTQAINERCGYGLTKLVAQYNANAVRRTLGNHYRYKQVVNADGTIDLEAEER